MVIMPEYKPGRRPFDFGSRQLFFFTDEVCVDSLLTPCVVVIVCCIHLQSDLSYCLIPLNV